MNPKEVKYRFRQHQLGGYEAELEWEAPDGGVVTKARGDTRAEAISRAAVLAQNALDNPVIKAVMPPQARIAFEVAKRLGLAQKSGTLAVAASKVVGPGAKRLAKVLKGFW